MTIWLVKRHLLTNCKSSVRGIVQSLVKLSLDSSWRWKDPADANHLKFLLIIQVELFQNLQVIKSLKPIIVSNKTSRGTRIFLSLQSKLWACRDLNFQRGDFSGLQREIESFRVLQRREKERDFGLYSCNTSKAKRNTQQSWNFRSGYSN